MVGSRVYVGGLPYGCREKDLEKFFKGYGRIRDILLKNGYGFVEFDDNRDAEDAVYELNGRPLLGERITVERARGTDRSRRGFGGGGRYGGGGYGGGRRRSPETSNTDREGNTKRYGPPRRTDYRVIVENLSSRISWQDLKDFMRKAGEVSYADAHRINRNEGVVEFTSYSEMKTAIEKLDGTELNGRRIRLIEDKRKSRRSYSSSSRSRSRSRSRSARSRSRSRSKSAGGRKASRSRSRSPAKKRATESRSRSRSPVADKSSRSPAKKHSRSRSPVAKKHARSSSSHSKSHSRSPVKKRSKARSASRDSERRYSDSPPPKDRSVSPRMKNGNGSGDEDDD